MKIQPRHVDNKKLMDAGLAHDLLAAWLKAQLGDSNLVDFTIEGIKAQ